MRLYVTKKDVYGNTLVYPSCAKANAFAAIAGTKTLTPEAIQEIKNLGYNILIKLEKI